MKKLFWLICSLLFLFSLTSCDEETPLDEILKYKITVDPTQEGNLQMNYQIEWKVLNDSREGPLEWVKIGVPNKYVSNIQKHSSSIDEISYYSDNGAFIRLDLDKKYYKGEVVYMEFSFLQTHIYTLKDNRVEYQFIPGWFDEIKVDCLQVYWNKENVIYQNSSSTGSGMIKDENYYVWETSLNYGESISVEVAYNQTSFINLSEDNSYSDTSGDEWVPIAIACVVALVILIFLVIGAVTYIRKNDGYYQFRGFSGTHHHYWWFYHSGYHRSGKKVSDPRIVNKSSGGSSGGHCACACACACAGGGRAGCSRKDFYQPKLKISDFEEIFNQKEENSK